MILLESAGLSEPARHVDPLASVLNGLAFDHITVPPAEGAVQISMNRVLDAVFGANG